VIRILIALCLASVAHGAVLLVQVKECHIGSTGTNTCTLNSNVTSGNLSIVMVGNTANDCTTPAANRTTYTSAHQSTNFGGDGEHACIWYGVYASSGAETVTKVSPAGPEIMRVFEFSGIASGTTVAAHSGDAPSFASSMTSGDMVTAAGSNIVVCVGGNNNTETFTSATPADTNYFDGPVCSGVGGACGGFDYQQTVGFLYKFAAAGTYNCSMGLTGAGRRMAIAGAVISFTPTLAKPGSFPYIM